MLIGEVVNKTGLSRDTIRFYEKQGLIKTRRTPKAFNNYKDYTSDTINRLLLIKRIKGFGFTLNETADLLDLIDTDRATCKTVTTQIKEKISLIEKKINELHEIKGLMNSLLTGCCQPETSNSNCQSLTNEKS